MIHWALLAVLATPALARPPEWVTAGKGFLVVVGFLLLLVAIMELASYRRKH